MLCAVFLCFQLCTAIIFRQHIPESLIKFAVQEALKTQLSLGGKGVFAQHSSHLKQTLLSFALNFPLHFEMHSQSFAFFLQGKLSIQTQLFWCYFWPLSKHACTL